MRANPKFHNSAILAIMVLVTSLVASLTAGEILIRYIGKNEVLNKEYYSPFKIYRSNKYYLHEPNDTNTYTVSEFSYPHITNQAGTTGRLFPKEKAGKIRIAILGDLFTEGLGAPPDSSYPVLLQNVFDSYNPDRVEILNAGLCGSDPVYEYELLKDYIALQNPDIVAINILSADIRDMRVRGGFERFNKDGTVEYKKAPWIEFPFSKSVLCRYFLTKVLSYDMLLTPPSRASLQTDSAISQINITLDSIANFSAQNGIKLLVVYNPTANEVIAKCLDLQKSLDYAKGRNIKTLDLLTYFLSNGLNSKNVYDYFWPQDFHNKSEGYKLYAKGVYDALIESYPEIFSKLDSAKAK